LVNATIPASNKILIVMERFPLGSM